MWFGTNGGGLSRYDGKRLVNFGAKDGLADHRVTTLHHTADGVMWVGTVNGGASRYDGKQFLTHFHESPVWSILPATNGGLWFGTSKGGVFQYNGEAQTNLKYRDGLAYNSVNVIHRTLDGMMWFGTEGRGVSRYDGAQEFVHFTTDDGLAHERVTAIEPAADGSLWVGTWNGVSQNRAHRTHDSVPSHRATSRSRNALQSDGARTVFCRTPTFRASWQADGRLFAYFGSEQ
jgi:ligand-binding sensor domain-containing protein